MCLKILGRIWICWRDGLNEICDEEQGTQDRALRHTCVDRGWLRSELFKLNELSTLCEMSKNMSQLSMVWTRGAQVRSSRFPIQPV